MAKPDLEPLEKTPPLSEKDPAFKDWVSLNRPFFDGLQNCNHLTKHNFKTLLRIEELAESVGCTVEEYFDQACSEVGQLGSFALQQANTEGGGVAIAIGIAEPLH